MTKRAARWILDLGTLTSLGLFLALTVDTHPQVYALSHDWPPQDRRLRISVGRAAVLRVGTGANLFRENGCFGCHRLEGTGGLLGPDLSHVGARLPYETIDAVLTAPRSVNPHAMMPAPGLLPEEREALARFLAGLS
jgi:mono/diheme cytochrome c family protein